MTDTRADRRGVLIALAVAAVLVVLMLLIRPDAAVAIRFGLELAALAALVYWGTRIGRTPGQRVTLAVVAPLAAAVVWVLLGAPGAVWLVPSPWHVGIEVVVFGGAAWALAAAGQRLWAVVYAVVFAVDDVLLTIWGQ